MRLQPKGPSRTKNTTDKKFTIAVVNSLPAIVKHYGGHFETTIFLKGNKAANRYTDSQKTMAIVKHYGIERRSVFSTEGSFGKGGVSQIASISKVENKLPTL